MRYWVSKPPADIDGVTDKHFVRQHIACEDTLIGFVLCWLLPIRQLNSANGNELEFVLYFLPFIPLHVFYKKQKEALFFTFTFFHDHLR